MQDVGTRGKARTPAWRDLLPLTVSFVTFSLLINVLSSPPPSYKIKKEKQRKWMCRTPVRTTSKAKLCSDKPAKPVPDSSRLAKASTYARLAELDQKWSDHFSRLEALLLARTLDKESTFQTVTVAHSPAAGAVKSTKPFIRPTDQTIYPVDTILCRFA